MFNAASVSSPNGGRGRFDAIGWTSAAAGVLLTCRLAPCAFHPTQQNDRTRRSFLFVAIDFLAFLVALLRFHREGGDRPGLQPLQRDRLAGLLAVAVGVVVDALQRRVDLGDQLALTVTGAQFDRAIGFG